MFVTGHRLSAVRNSEAVLVLEYGRRTERGTHEEPIQEKGACYPLFLIYANNPKGGRLLCLHSVCRL